MLRECVRAGQMEYAAIIVRYCVAPGCCDASATDNMVEFGVGQQKTYSLYMLRASPWLID